MAPANADPTWVPIVFNRTAGAGSGEDHVDRLVRALRDRGLEPETFACREAFEAGLLDSRRRDQCRCLVAAGGDGTVGYAINVHRTAPLAIFPVGSENLLARHLGFGLDPERLADTIIAGKSRTLDLGRVDGRYFSLMASVGFDSDVIDRLHAARTGHVTKWDYAVNIVRCLARYRYPMLSVECDGTPLAGPVHHLFVFNLPQYALGLPISPESRGEDGWLDLVALRRRGSYHLLRYIVAIVRGRIGELRDVVHRKVRQVRVRSAGRAAIQVDGDPAGVAPVSIEVAPAALTVLTPVEPTSFRGRK